MAVEQTGCPRQADLTMHQVVAEGVWLQGVAVVLWADVHVDLAGPADEVAVAVEKQTKQCQLLIF